LNSYRRGNWRSISFALVFLLTAFSFSPSAFSAKPDDDPSALTGPIFGDLPEGLPEANEGALEGGETGTIEDASAENVLQLEDQRDDGRFNVPSNGPPSPLYKAKPFTQKMLRFEEFGTDSLDLNGEQQPGWQPMPAPPDPQSAPDGLDGFLSQEIWPIPSQVSNTWDTNPWEAMIESYLGRGLGHPPAEGRPPGQGWSHQRWNEFRRPRQWRSA
jgi:hypothetical protein